MAASASPTHTLPGIIKYCGCLDVINPISVGCSVSFCVSSFCVWGLESSQDFSLIWGFFLFIPVALMSSRGHTAVWMEPSSWPPFVGDACVNSVMECKHHFMILISELALVLPSNEEGLITNSICHLLRSLRSETSPGRWLRNQEHLNFIPINGAL